jgi:hypothetical protein
MGRMEMSKLQTNDLVLTMNPQTGELQFSPILMWLDRDESNSELYVNLTTKSGKQIRLTSSHLIYLADEPMPLGSGFGGAAGGSNHNYIRFGRLAGSTTGQTNDKLNSGNNYYYDVVGADVAADRLSDYVYTTYARNAVVGQYLLVHRPRDDTTTKNDTSAASTPPTTTTTRVVFDEIVSINYVTKNGIYAPLTRDGNIVVNSVVASCYAVISDHDMAHWAMAPVRWLSLLNEKLFGVTRPAPADFNQERRYSQEETSRKPTDTTTTTRRIHWYAILLYNIARYVLPNDYLY